MIHVKGSKKGDGFTVTVEGSSKQIIDETSGIIEEIIESVYNDFLTLADDKIARRIAKMEFAMIIGMSTDRIKESLGFDILGDDEEEVEQKVAEKKPNPFTMGMSGDALTQFLMGMRGEEF